MPQLAGLIMVVTLCLTLTACGTPKERTAPCKRPANMASFNEDQRHGCGPMRAINDPTRAFAAIGLLQEASK